jgi:hypothetical protein
MLLLIYNPHEAWLLSVLFRRLDFFSWWQGLLVDHLDTFQPTVV